MCLPCHSHGVVAAASPPFPGRNQSDPNPHIPPVPSWSEPQTPRLQGCPGAPLLALQPPGFGVLSLLCFIIPVTTCPGHGARAQVTVGTRAVSVAVPSCPLWLCGMCSRAPLLPGVMGSAGAPGGCRRLRALQGPAHPRLGWGCSSCPAQPEGSTWKPRGWMKNCTSVLGFSFVGLGGFVYLGF